MNSIVKKKLVFPVLLFALLLSGTYTAFEPASNECDGCKRTAVLKGSTGEIDSDSFTSRMAERVTTPCFHLLYSGKIKEPGAYSKGKPPEYYFTAGYENNLPGKIKSRLSINLFFENGELVHQWVTESDNPNFTYHAHLQKMFINPTALLRKWAPLNITLLNNFEKQPSQCDIKPDKEELFPGQETKVKISNIVDFEGRKSREFNRIVVQAVKGEIVGGTPLASDPELKAFQVGNGDITFTYVAPDNENSQAAEDKIIVYNSCDILRKDEYPMPKTAPKDKIAEKKITLIRANYAIAKITEKYEVICDEGTVQTLSAKLDVILKYSHTDSSVECYDAVSWNVRGSGNWSIYTTHHVEKSNKIPGGKLLIFFDSKTGKATRIDFSGFGYSFIFDTPHGIIREGAIGVADSAAYVKGGDGIHTMEGMGTDVVNGACMLKTTSKWNIKRYKK